MDDTICVDSNIDQKIHEKENEKKRDERRTNEWVSYNNDKSAMGK